MAVNDRNEQNQHHQARTQQEAPKSQTAGYGNQGYRHPGSTPIGMANINQVLVRTGATDQSDVRSNEALRGLKEAEQVALAAQELTPDVEIIRFDRTVNRVGLPAILVVKTMRSAGEVHAVVRTLLLDSDTLRLKPRIEQMGNVRIETPTRPQDVFNNTYWNRIEEFLRRLRGVPEMKIYNAEAVVVPTDFDFKDVERCRQLLIQANNRCDDMIARLSGEPPLSIAAIKLEDERFIAHVDFTGQQLFNSVGNPIRADILVTMERAGGQSNQEEDYFDQERQISTVAGFINYEYAPDQNAPTTGWNQPQQPQPIFTPTFVITDVANAPWIRAQTLELYLMAFSNAYRVTAGTQWVRTSLPQITAKKGIDPRDIAGLAYLTPVGQKPDTKSDKFTDQDFIDFMTALVRPKPAFVIDVDPVGDHAGIENYFLEAALTGPNQQRAIHVIVEAANNLTGNKFSKYFDVTKTPIVVPYGQEIHMGYYIDENGEKRDIRDLDVLAMLNLSQGNVTDFMEWYRTFYDQSLSPAQKLQRREQFERQFLGKNLKITGRAVRLLVTPQFIEALDAATRDAGLQVDFDDMVTIMGGQRFVGNTLVNQYMVSNTAQVRYGAPIQTTVNHTYGGVTGSGRVY